MKFELNKQSVSALSMKTTLRTIENASKKEKTSLF